MRYNGTFFSVPGTSIEKYISAFIENFAEYEQLKAVVPNGGDFSKPTKMGMMIRIGDFAQGVCIRTYHMPIDSTQKLEKVINGYRYAAKRALQVQKLLSTL